MGSACDIVQAVAVPEGFEVTFGDQHKSTFPPSLSSKSDDPSLSHKRHGFVHPTFWTADIHANPPTVPYTEVTQPGPGMGQLMRKVREYGFAFVSGVPPTAAASEALLARIGPIRHTHYGGFYDFTADLARRDTAYTSEALEPHTDNTYFTEPAGLQALHLLAHVGGRGGASSLVDGFGAAAQLRRRAPAAYARLAATGVYAHASGNAGLSFQPAQAFPTFAHHPEHSQLVQVRWNNADRAGVATPHTELDAWYDAAGKFDAILSQPQNQYWFQLEPGTMLIFDNWRALHGRAAFTGQRRMCGGYINRDDFISRYRMTNLSEEDVRASTVTG